LQAGVFGEFIEPARPPHNVVLGEDDPVDVVRIVPSAKAVEEGIIPVLERLPQAKACAAD